MIKRQEYIKNHKLFGGPKKKFLDGRYKLDPIYKIFGSYLESELELPTK